MEKNIHIYIWITESPSYIVEINTLLIKWNKIDMDMVEAVHAEGQGIYRDSLYFSAQFCCEPKTVLKKNYLKGKI